MNTIPLTIALPQNADSYDVIVALESFEEIGTKRFRFINKVKPEIMIPFDDLRLYKFRGFKFLEVGYICDDVLIDTITIKLESQAEVVKI